MIVRLYGIAFCMSILFFLILIVLGQKQKVTNFLLLFMAITISNFGYYSICTAEYSRFMSAAGWKAACSVSPYLCVHDSVLCISNQFGNGILQQCGAGYKRRRLFFKEGIRTDA